METKIEQKMLDDNALWQFAVHFYQAPGIATQLLALQNQYALNINQLIFAIWLATQKHQLTGFPEVTTASESWRNDIVIPLRNLRFNIKQQKNSTAEDVSASIGVVKPAHLIEACYQQLLKAELAAEKVELSYLYQQRNEYSQIQFQSKSSAELVFENLNICWDLCLVNNSESEFKEQVQLFNGAVIKWLKES
ncbi:MAG: TIGR02444 family protein [Oceanospirillaceae bacterium]